MPDEPPVPDGVPPAQLHDVPAQVQSPAPPDPPEPPGAPRFGPDSLVTQALIAMVPTSNDRHIPHNPQARSADTPLETCPSAFPKEVCVPPIAVSSVNGALLTFSSTLRMC